MCSLKALQSDIHKNNLNDMQHSYVQISVCTPVGFWIKCRVYLEVQSLFSLAILATGPLRVNMRLL